MNFNSTTFCAAPWFQIRKEMNDLYRPCCEFNTSKSNFEGRTDYSWPDISPTEYLDSEYVKYVRQNLTQGIQLSECQKCWKKESISLTSLRQTINNTITNNQGKNLNNTWLNSYFQQKTNFDFDQLISADVKVSNLCNFSCSMCNPTDSSQIYTIWKKNQSHKIVQMTLNTDPDYLNNIKKKHILSDYNYLDTILDSCPKHLKLLGGEPLLDNMLLKRLLNLPQRKQSKISLHFVTNGSVDLCDFSSQLLNYRQINYVVSLDGVGHVQDYIRRGSNWNQIQDNILKWNAHHRPVDISFTLQCFNAWHVPEFVNWCTLHNLKFTVGTVHTPDYLSLNAIPVDLREKIFQRYDQELSNNQASCFKELINNCSYQSNLTSVTAEFLKWYDPNSHWRNIFPEWREFIE